jgi:hypothetical protein
LVLVFIFFQRYFVSGMAGAVKVKLMQDSSIPSKRIRVIVNTDAKNEADDQYAIVHAILTPMFELHGIIPAHFGERISKTASKTVRTRS